MEKDMQQIPINEIVTNSDQPRKSFYDESLQELAASIKERGVLEPLVVRPFADGADGVRYQIVMGERRYRAAQLVGLTTVPAMVREMSDEDVQIDALLENFQREDLNPIDRARAIQGLLGFLSWDKTAKALGVSETTLRRSLELLELPDFIQEELTSKPGTEGALAEGTARALAVLGHDPDTQRKMLRKINGERLTHPQTERLIQAILQYPSRRDVFLKVPVHVTDRILKTLLGPVLKSSTAKPPTVQKRMSTLDKIVEDLAGGLDVSQLESMEKSELYQLLASGAEIARLLDEFNNKVRAQIKRAEGELKEVYIHCPLCGRRELIGAQRCSVCWTPLLRLQQLRPTAKRV
jgi:ParB family chromosome partitioning protein